MKNKILISIIIFITLFLTISCIYANENITDEDLGVLEDNSISVETGNDATNSPKSVETGNDATNSPKSLKTGIDEINNPLSNVSQSEEDNNSSSAVSESDAKNNQNETKISENASSTNTNKTNQTNASTKSNASSKYKTHIKVIKLNVTYHVGSIRETYKLKLLDYKNKPISGKKLKLNVCNKTYTAKTNSKGVATFYISNLKKGTKVVKFSFAKSGKYLASKGSAKIKVKAKLTKDNGYWLDYDHMFNTNYKKLSKKGVKHVFILSASFTKFGEKKVLNMIKKAHKYGIKVHVWMCTFNNDGKFMPPAYKNGKFNYKRINYLVKRVKYLVSLKEVDGIHFDYLRYPGTAYKYKNGVKAVNYFVKTATQAIRAKSQRIIISAAVMCEPNSLKHYYAQDIPTLSKYLDVIVPMAYKGNYRASTKWIKKSTQQFIKISKGPQIWAGLQAYRSDSNRKKLPYKELYNDALAAKKGGASGVILFKLGLSQNLNFKKL